MEFPPPDLPPANFGQPSFGAQAAPNFSLPVPPYHQMITTAILALNERDGSSRQAISRYIENEFKNLPPTHSNELTQELRRMKNNGQLVLVKHSYMLPGSLSFAVANDFLPQGGVQISDGPKRRPGRPPKLKPEIQPNGSAGVVSPPPAPPQSFGFVVDAPLHMREQSYGVPTTSLFGGLTSGVQFSGVQFTGPVTNAPTMSTIGAVTNVGTVFNSGAPASATTVPVEQNDGPPAKRRPGRPPKVNLPAVSVEPETNDGPDMNDGLPQEASPVLGKRVRARPAKFMLMSLPLRAGMNRGRGRPPSFARTGRRGRPRKLPVSTIKPTGRPRGRPPKNGVGSVVSVDGIGDGVVLSEAKKPRKLSGKPLGRPKKHASVATVFASEQEESLAFETLKDKVEHFQSRIKQAVTVVKPYLNEAAVIAIGALQDLEELASMDIINAPENVESAQVDDLNGPVNVETAQVGDLNAPLDFHNVPVNFQSAPLTAQTAYVNVQSAPLAPQSTPDQQPPSLQTW